VLRDVARRKAIASDATVIIANRRRVEADIVEKA
jgi:hypothetical protein